MIFIRFFVFQTANIIVLSFGTCVGWFSPALRVLLSNESPLKTGPLNNQELSWIGAMNSFGGLCGTFISGCLSIRLGSKRAMTMLAFPAIAAWILIYFGDSFYHIFFARFATGLTGQSYTHHILLYAICKRIFFRWWLPIGRHSLRR